MNKLTSKLWEKIDWKTLRKNENENKGNPMEDFDGFVDTVDGETCIVEYTNIYTLDSQKSKQVWEQSRRDNDNSEENIAKILEGYNLNKDGFIKEFQGAHSRKNNKKYMQRSEKKILVLEVSGVFIGWFMMINFMFEFKGRMLPGNNLSFLLEMKQHLIEENNFDEIIFRLYPNQIKEETLSLGAAEFRDDIIISLSKGYSKKPELPKFPLEFK